MTKEVEKDSVSRLEDMQVAEAIRASLEISAEIDADTEQAQLVAALQRSVLESATEMPGNQVQHHQSKKGEEAEEPRP